jgi:hypothetical protein
MHTNFKIKSGAAVFTLKIKGDLRIEECQFDILRSLRKLMVENKIVERKYLHIELSHLSPKGRRGAIRLLTHGRKSPAKKFFFTATYND